LVSFFLFPVSPYPSLATLFIFTTALPRYEFKDVWAKLTLEFGANQTGANGKIGSFRMR
jgi:hypothetical protein